MRKSAVVRTPMGPLEIVADDGAIVSILFVAKKAAPAEDPLLRRAVRQLEEYFAGKRREFDLPLRLEGTAFQKRVWNELTRIPYGTTIPYRELARRVGDAKACRAVGAANGRNPISVVVPCHRVIGADGSLTGYGGGIEKKRELLGLERKSVRT